MSRPFKDKQRSSSWTTSTSDDPRKTADTVAARGCSEELLNPEKREDLDLFKREYCELLYSFRLLNKRAEILKCLGHPPDPQRGVGNFISITFTTIDGVTLKTVKDQQRIVCQELQTFGNMMI